MGQSPFTRSGIGKNMAWNESGNGKNPWDRDGNDGPPDLDKIVRDWQRRFKSMFGGKGGGRDVFESAFEGVQIALSIILVRPRPAQFLAQAAGGHGGA